MSEGTAHLILEELRLFRTRTEENISDLHKKIDGVVIQTTKTNGRVNNLEKQQNECPGKEAINYINANKLRNSKQYQIGQLVITLITVSGVVGIIELVKHFV